MLQEWRPQHLTFSYGLDRAQLKEFVAKLSVTQAQAPVDATVVVQNGVPQVQPDKNGLGIDKNKLIGIITDSIDGQVEQVIVTRSAVAADVGLPQATTAAEQAKKLMATPITLTYGDKKFQPTPAQIGAWLTFVKADDNTLQVGIDQAKIQGYFGTFAGQVEIASVPKKVTAVNGEVKGTEGGTDGLAIDKATLAGRVGTAVLAASPATLAIPTSVVAFKTIYNNSVSLDAPKYIEINLSTQHLWAYQDHQLVFESPITSGATGAGFPTVQGLFSIYAKEQNRYLDGRPLGYNYNVFVQYWMPFYQDYGLHDASWRSAYGGSDYYYNGSHGCVNLPLDTAAWLWGWDEIGTPVWVHS
jgi:lipoprotein-anchoring transpeptidase ErfK/SrfK